MPIRDKELYNENTPFLKHFLGETPEEAEEVYKKYTPLMSSLARSYSQMTGLEYDDLFSEAMIGLARAKRDFSEERGSDFLTFAHYKIKDVLREYVASQEFAISIPQYIKEAHRVFNKLNYLLAQYELNLNEVSDADWKKLLERKDGTVQKILGLKRTLQNIADRSGATIEDIIERTDVVQCLYNHKAQVEEQEEQVDQACVNYNEEADLVDRLNFNSRLNRIKEVLDEDEFSLIHKHFIEHKTVRQIADELQISAPSASVRITLAIKKAKKRLNKNYGIERNCKEVTTGM